MSELLIVLPAVFLAFTVEAATGFGATVLAVALATRVWPLQELLSALVPVNAVLSATIAWKHRAEIDVPTLRSEVLPAMLLGFPLGVWALREGGRQQGSSLLTAFGAFIVLLAARDLVRRAPQGSTPTSAPGWRGRAAMFVAGVVHGAWNTAGPIVVAVLSRKGWDKGRFRATLSMLWVSFSVLALLGFAQDGALDRRSAFRSLLLVPALILGRAAGQWLHTRVSATGFRRAVSFVLLLAGLSILRRSMITSGP